jgi:hypothetical protein
MRSVRYIDAQNNIDLPEQHVKNGGEHMSHRTEALCLYAGEIDEPDPFEVGGPFLEQAAAVIDNNFVASLDESRREFEEKSFISPVCMREAPASQKGDAEFAIVLWVLLECFQRWVHERVQLPFAQFRLSTLSPIAVPSLS